MARRRVPAARYQGGIALIAALWITILLTVIASSFAFSMRGEAMSARNALSLAQARAFADGAVERTVFELQRPRQLAGVWNPDGQPRSWQEGDAAIVVHATDEAARIDLNAGAEVLLKGLFTAVGGLDADAAQAVVDAIVDWRDPDELRRPNGAEEPEYRAAGRSYRPANATFEAVGDLRLVLGMTPAVYARVADSLTVHSQQPGINPATAGRDALLAIPGVTAEEVDQFIAQRSDALQNALPVPQFPKAQAFLSAGVPVWSIRAEARLPDGVTFVRDAVVRPSVDPLRPVVALLWQDGIVQPRLEPDPGAATAAPKGNGSNDR